MTERLEDDVIEIVRRNHWIAESLGKAIDIVDEEGAGSYATNINSYSVMTLFLAGHSYLAVYPVLAEFDGVPGIEIRIDGAPGDYSADALEGYVRWEHPFTDDIGGFKVTHPLDGDWVPLPEVTEGFLRIVAKACRHRLASHRARTHEITVVDELSNILGRDVPQPKYTSDSDWHHIDITTGPIGDVDPRLAETVAKVIESAHSVNPDSWSLGSHAGNPVLFIGSLSAGGLGSRNSYRILVRYSSLSDEGREAFASLGGVDAAKHDSELGHVRLEGDEWEKYGKLMEPARIAGAVYNAGRSGMCNRWREHRPEWVDILSGIVGIELPQPGYIDRLLEERASQRAIEMHPEQSDANQPASPKVPFGTAALIDAFAVAGLSYSNAQIATFFTGLQTKGFVVLSGISGTGKSKIAQRFVELLPEATYTTTTEDEESIDFTVRVRKYTREISGSIVPYMKAGRLPGMGEVGRVPVDVEFEGATSQGWLRRTASTNGSFETILFYGRQVGSRIRKMRLGEQLFVHPVVSEDGQSLARIELGRVPFTPADGEQEVQTVTNHLFLSVRPDWRDSTALLGYYNPLTQAYQWTEFLRFVLRAEENFREAPEHRIAWFVILDEMNLAQVEYYFADLLSVIESGRDATGMSREPLRMTYPEASDDDFPPHEIYLPPNLYVIGTVNMDETTHAFSPKVLDRAFTIELTTVDFRDYPPQPSNEGGSNGADKTALLDVFSRGGRFAQIDKAEIAEIVNAHPEIRYWLQGLNARLAEVRFHFGYRVFDEIAQYLFNNRQTGLTTFEDAFDQAVLMKVLPKFTGSRARVVRPLQLVVAWARNPESIVVGNGLPEFDLQAALPSTYRRAAEMLHAVEVDGFVSFG